MSFLGVSLADYNSNSQFGFGTSSFEEKSLLEKALSADQITGRTTDGLTTPGSGAPLKVESLERNLKNITFKESDIVLWRDIRKLPAYNTVEEYNRMVSYGQDRGGFNLEGELPEEEDSTYQRKSELVKFLGVTRSVTHPMTLVRTNIGPAIQSEVRNGIMWILRKVNQSLTTANSANIPVEFNGIYKQHQEGYATPGAYTKSEYVIDLRGDTLAEEDMENAARTIIDNFGAVDCLYAPPIVLSNFTKIFYPNLQQFAPVPNSTKVGRRVTHVQTQFGEVELKFDKFLKRPPIKTTASPATSTKAPNAPTGGTVTPNATDPESLWAASDAGDYYFAVTAVNRYGESALHTINSGALATIVAGGSVDLAFADGGGATPATAYRVYRSDENPANLAAASFQHCFDISIAEKAAGYDGGAATVVRDVNRYMPGTDKAFILERSPEILAFKQLAPIMKMDLALLAPSYRFMILLYGTPILYQPTKVVRFINIGNN